MDITLSPYLCLTPTSLIRIHLKYSVPLQSLRSPCSRLWGSDQKQRAIEKEHIGRCRLKESFKATSEQSCTATAPHRIHRSDQLRHPASMAPPRGRGKGRPAGSLGRGGRQNTPRVQRDRSHYAGPGFSEIPASAVDQGRRSDGSEDGSSEGEQTGSVRRVVRRLLTPQPFAESDELVNQVPVAMWVRRAQPSRQRSFGVLQAFDVLSVYRTLTTATLGNAVGRNSHGTTSCRNSGSASGSRASS